MKKNQYLFNTLQIFNIDIRNCTLIQQLFFVTHYRRQMEIRPRYMHLFKQQNRLLSLLNTHLYISIIFKALIPTQSTQHYDRFYNTLSYSKTSYRKSKQKEKKAHQSLIRTDTYARQIALTMMEASLVNQIKMTIKKNILHINI